MAASSSHHASRAKNILDDLDLTKPVYRGFLFKQAHLHQTFNKRYFVLYPNVLVYYDSEQDYARDVAKKTLEHRDKGYRLDGIYLSKPAKKPHGAKFCFVLHCPNQHNDRKELLLVAETRDERKRWMEKLQEQNTALLSGAGGGATLEVPRQRIRANSVGPTDDTGDPQNLQVMDGSSDTES